MNDIIEPSFIFFMHAGFTFSWSACNFFVMWTFVRGSSEGYLLFHAGFLLFLSAFFRETFCREVLLNSMIMIKFGKTGNVIDPNSQNIYF